MKLLNWLFLFTFITLSLFACDAKPQTSTQGNLIIVDAYCIDSIVQLQQVDPQKALVRIDSLRQRCQERGWQECSQVKLEAVNSLIYINLADQVNGLSTAFASLNFTSEDKEEEVFWQLKSLQTIAHQYIKSQNWILAAKYLHEMEEMAKHSNQTIYYSYISSSLNALIEMLHGNTPMALAYIDQIPDLEILKNQMSMTDAMELICKKLYYRGSINGFGGKYEDSTKDYLMMIDLLESEKQHQIDSITRSIYLLRAYAYLSDLYAVMENYDLAAACYDNAMLYRKDIVSGDRSTRNLVDYLFDSGRYDELEKMLLPVITANNADHAIAHEMDHYMKLYIRSLHNRGLYVQAVPWVEQFMDATRILFLEKGKRGMSEFKYAYEAEVQKVQMLQQESDMLKQRYLINTLLFFLCLIVIVLLLIYFRYRHQKKNNRFLFNQVQELNSTYNKLSQVMLSQKVAESAPDVDNHEEDDVQTYKRLQDFLFNDNLFLNKELHIEEVQNAINISASTLNRRMKKLMNMSFYEYLTYIRLDYACNLLLSTDKIIDAIADESGFNSTRTFQRQFKERYNLSPTQFRNMNKNNTV